MLAAAALEFMELGPLGSVEVAVEGMEAHQTVALAQRVPLIEAVVAVVDQLQGRLGHLMAATAALA